MRAFHQKIYITGQRFTECEAMQADQRVPSPRMSSKKIIRKNTWEKKRTRCQKFNPNTRNKEIPDRWAPIYEKTLPKWWEIDRGRRWSNASKKTSPTSPWQDKLHLSGARKLVALSPHIALINLLSWAGLGDKRANWEQMTFGPAHPSLNVSAFLFKCKHWIVFAMK